VEIFDGEFVALAHGRSLCQKRVADENKQESSHGVEPFSHCRASRSSFPLTAPAKINSQHAIGPCLVCRGNLTVVPCTLGRRPRLVATAPIIGTAGAVDRETAIRREGETQNELLNRIRRFFSE
jgi:hypothetical protein